MNDDGQVTPSDLSYYGTYRCLAMNIHGKDEHAIDLREARPPGPLLQTKFETITGEFPVPDSWTWLSIYFVSKSCPIIINRVFISHSISLCSDDHHFQLYRPRRQWRSAHWGFCSPIQIGRPSLGRETFAARLACRWAQPILRFAWLDIAREHRFVFVQFFFLSLLRFIFSFFFLWRCPFAFLLFRF